MTYSVAEVSLQIDVYPTAAHRDKAPKLLRGEPRVLDLNRATQTRSINGSKTNDYTFIYGLPMDKLYLVIGNL